MYQLPKINHQEIGKVFSLSDLRETKGYQEALAEGREEGRQQGREEGKLVAKQNLILSQLNLKLAKFSPSIEAEVNQLSLTELDNLALALFNFSNVEDLQQWLNNTKNC